VSDRSAAAVAAAAFVMAAVALVTAVRARVRAVAAEEVFHARVATLEAAFVRAEGRLSTLRTIAGSADGERRSAAAIEQELLGSAQFRAAIHDLVDGMAEEKLRAAHAVEREKHFAAFVRGARLSEVQEAELTRLCREAAGARQALLDRLAGAHGRDDAAGRKLEEITAALERDVRAVLEADQYKEWSAGICW